MTWHDPTRRQIPDPSLEEFSGWLPPSNFIAHLKGPRSQGLVDGILQRLENGFMFSAAGISSWRGEDHRLQKRMAPVSIEAEWWKDADGVRHYWETLWTLGDCKCRVYDGEQRQYIDVAFTAVKFEPSGLANDIAALKANSILSTKTAETQGAEATIEGAIAHGRIVQSARALDGGDTDGAGADAAAIVQYGYRLIPPPLEPSDAGTERAGAKTPISDATLRAWWEMCKTMKPSNLWGADEMRAFFTRCFPNRSVSRDRLRGVRPAPTSGPKGKSAE